MSADFPLFSFLVVCYNQEEYIEEALLSALSQNYQNLEIIVSDDCSTDRTFEIAERITKAYIGSHRIILNKNEHNLGIGANFYRAYTFSSGEWIFMAAGDDISYPNRASEIYEIIQRNPHFYGINTAREVINSNGQSKGYDYWNGAMLGASSSWHRKVFTDFPPLKREIMSEDLVLQFRALLLGGIIYSTIITTKYRRHGSSVSKTAVSNIMEFKQQCLKRATFYKYILETRNDDLTYFSQKNRTNLNIDLIKKNNDERGALNDLKIKEYEVAIAVLGGSLKNLLCYLIKGENGIHSKFLYRIKLSLMKSKIFGLLFSSKYEYNNEYEIHKRHLLEHNQTLEDYLKLPIGKL